MSTPKEQFNRHGYYVSMHRPCVCCTVDTTAFIDDVMAEFDRVGKGVRDVQLCDGKFKVDTRIGFGLHTQARLGADPLDVPQIVEQWIEWWHKARRKMS